MGITDFIVEHMDILLTYLLFINLLAFAQFGVDKHRARRNMWRISETALLISALLGGSVGAILGMKAFRHKTLHRKFTIGLPLILTLHILLAAFVLFIVLCR